MYLSAKAIAALEGKNKAHFLNPDAARINKSLGDAAGLQNIGVHQIAVAPGHPSTEFHRHLYEEECVYVLSGTGTAVAGDEQQPIGPGDFLAYPAGGEAHELVNDGDEPLVCLVIGQRLAQDVTDYPRKGKRLYRNSGRREVVDHAAIEPLERGRRRSNKSTKTRT